jgi:cell division septal protein FtsQ
MEERTFHRAVKTPEIDPSQAWNTFAQRQEQRRRERARPQHYVAPKPIARTYAKTGTYASSGRIRAVPRSFAQQGEQHSSPIPIRSGHKSWLRRFWLRLLSLFAILAVLVLLLNLMFTSSAFRIAQVNVVGTHNRALIDSIQRMGMQGQNIFLVNVDGLTQRVDANPLVSSTTLSKNWPNQLTITVTERVPALLWQTAQGTYSVDTQGVVIAPASATANAASLMTVVDAQAGKGQEIHPGTHLDAGDVAFAISVFQQLPSMTGLTTFTLRYTRAADGTGVFAVQSTTGLVAYLGGGQDVNPLSNRLIELQQVLQLAQRQQLSLATVDVRYGLYPVYTLKS